MNKTASMSLLTQAYLLERYGPRLTLEQLAEVLALKVKTVRNQIHLGTFPVPTYLDGHRVADFRDVAAYLDERREEALRAHEASLA